MKRIAIALTLCILTIFATQALGQGAGDELFDNAFLHKIDFEAPSLEAILPFESGSFQDPVKMTIDGQVVEDIFLRRKGNTSNLFVDDTPPFKVNLDEFVTDQEYDGIDIFNLHNHLLDPHYQAEAVAYALYGRAGVPALRTAFAEVSINGDFVGVYTIAEDIDKKFLKSRFSASSGSLYKGIFQALSVGVKQGTIEAYERYVNDVTPETFSAHVNTQNFFRVLAVDNMILDPDVYAGGSHNFNMYHEPNEERLHLITWDHNMAFRLEEDWSLNSVFPWKEPERSILTSAEVKPDYLRTLCDLMGYLLDPDYVEALVMHNDAILRSNSHGVEIGSPQEIIDKLASQRRFFLAELAKEGFDGCEELSPPIAIGDLVINEFLTKSEDGDDWVELYNSSDTDILLDGRFYLSDDSETRKRWRFPAGTVIPAGGYLVVWADRDIAAEGIHANFKLNSGQGSLFLVYEDLTVLDEVHYGEQEPDMSYARVPNGSGAFRIQEQTLGLANSQGGAAPASISAVTRSGDGVSFVVTGSAEAYDIAYSHNLIDWQTIQSAVPPETTVEDTDRERQARERGYYRLTVPE